MSRVSKDSAYYENTHTEEEFLIYYSGKYAKRNEVLIDQLLSVIPPNANVLDLAAGSSYIAERLLTRPRASIESYVWNDFNPKLVETVKRRVSDSRFKIDPFDADADDVSLEKYDVFICISLEHIEADVEILNKLKSGCVVSICSPNFDDPAHVRVFTSMKQFRDRYSPVIKVSHENTCRNGHEEKYVITGVKK